MVLDGTGARPPRAADVLVRDNRIEAVLDRELGSAAAAGRDLPGAPRVDCSGAYVAPGFIDIHSHSDLAWLSNPDSLSRISQGVTTEVVGNCGMSPAPRDPADSSFRQAISVIDLDPDTPLAFATFAEYIQVLRAHRAAVNIVPLVGHGSIRQTALFSATSSCPAVEIETLLRDALEAGAWGTSLGLMYPPGEAADQEELAQVARITASSDALLTAHMRAYDAAGLLAAIDEVCDMATHTSVHLQLSHLRVLRASTSGIVDKCLERLDAAGPDVHADAYPYTAGQTTLFQLLAAEDRREGVATFLGAVGRRRGRFAAGIAATGYSPDKIIVVRVTDPEDANKVGRSLAECADEASCDWSELAVDLLERSRGYVDVVVFGSNLSEQEQILAHEKVMIGSDGFSLSTDYPATVHPRAFGAFPKALQLLVELGMPWAQAIAKATGDPARKLGLADRGTVQPGAIADLTVFDPDAFHDEATYEHPLRPAVGLRHVIVGGVPVIDGGRRTGARPGRVLLKN